MDKLRCMEVYVTVADAGSFTAAAEALSISAVMVGKHIHQLEGHLGVRLIQRSTRRQSLTDAGRVFLADCRKVIEQVRWAESSVERLSGTPSGLLKITAPLTLGMHVVAPLVADFMAAHPQVRVELALTDSMVDLLDEGCDVAVRIGDLGDVALVARPLQPYRMVICASPAYLQRHGHPATPADLPRHDCLGHLLWSGRAAWRLSDGAEGAPWPRETRLASNSGQALRVAALRGLGLLMQPEAMLAEDIAAGLLVPVLTSFLPPPRPVHLVYLPDRRPLPKLSAFVDFAVARLGAHPPGR